MNRVEGSCFGYVRNIAGSCFGGRRSNVLGACIRRTNHELGSSIVRSLRPLPGLELRSQITRVNLSLQVKTEQTPFPSVIGKHSRIDNISTLI